MKKRKLIISALLLMSLSITACEMTFDFGSISRPSSNSSLSNSSIVEDSSSSEINSSSGGASSSQSSSSSSSSSSSHIEPNNVTLDIFAFNDTHGNVKDTFGEGLGISKTATALKELSQGKNSIFISQGDMWQGSVESNYTRGNLVTEWMNSLNFVSMTVGNHEYDWGKEPIIQNRTLANFPTLGINVLNRSNDKRVDYLDPSVTFTRGDAKIGVIGAIGNCLSSISSSKVNGIYFATGSTLTNLVKAEANRLRNEENCDFIIYSIHGSGSRDEADTYDISLSNQHYVDLVLEGHTHDAYAEKDSAGIYHVQCKGYNNNIYQITVNLDVNNHTIDVRTPTLLDFSYSNSPYKNYTNDATTEALFDKYYDQYSFAYETIGQVSEGKNSTTLKSKVADLYLDEGLKRWGSTYNIVLGGGFISCRGNNYLPAGNVTYSQLATLFPFDNAIVLCSITGNNFRNSNFIKGNSNYYMTWTDYGSGFRDDPYEIDNFTTYYLVTDTYSSDYAYNRLTVVDVLDENTFARDLLADYISAGNWA